MDDAILEHLPVARRAAYLTWRKLRWLRLDLEELNAEAAAALVELAPKVRPERLKKISVRSYLLMTLKRRLLDRVRAEYGRRFQKVALRACGAQIGEDAGPEDASSREARDDFDGDDAAQALCDVLPPGPAKVVRYLASVRWCYGCGAMAAREFGCSESNVAHVLAVARRALAEGRGRGWAEAFLRGEESA